MKKLRRLLISLAFWLTPEEQANLRYGFPRNFQLPYPYPRNEHEEGMNWVSVNAVISGKQDW